MVTIKIETGNAAFGESFNDEVARILRDLADAFEADCKPMGVYDINGNRVGSVKVS